MRLAFFITLILTVASTGCDRASKAAQSPAAPPPLLIAPEDLVTVRSSALSSGPLITGTLQPDRKVLEPMPEQDMGLLTAYIFLLVLLSAALSPYFGGLLYWCAALSQDLYGYGVLLDDHRSQFSLCHRSRSTREEAP